MLDHEPELEACEKRWIVNRIVDPQQEAAIIALCWRSAGSRAICIFPSSSDAYGRIGWDLRRVSR
jgi:hypothetical protein